MPDSRIFLKNQKIIAAKPLYVQETNFEGNRGDETEMSQSLVNFSSKSKSRTAILQNRTVRYILCQEKTGWAMT